MDKLGILVLGQTPRPDIEQQFNLDDYASAERPHAPELQLTARCGSWGEVELGLSEAMAQEEAKRCLRCDLEWLDYMKIPRPAVSIETVEAQPANRQAG